MSHGSKGVDSTVHARASASRQAQPAHRTTRRKALARRARASRVAALEGGPRPSPPALAWQGEKKGGEGRVSGGVSGGEVVVPLPPRGGGACGRARSHRGEAAATEGGASGKGRARRARRRPLPPRHLGGQARCPTLRPARVRPDRGRDPAGGPPPGARQVRAALRARDSKKKNSGPPISLAPPPRPTSPPPPHLPRLGHVLLGHLARALELDDGVRQQEQGVDGERKDDEHRGRPGLGPVRGGPGRRPATKGGHGFLEWGGRCGRRGERGVAEEGESERAKPRWSTRARGGKRREWAAEGGKQGERAKKKKKSLTTLGFGPRFASARGGDTGTHAHPFTPPLPHHVQIRQRPHQAAQ